MSFMVNHPQSSHNKEYKKREEEKRVFKKNKVFKKTSHFSPDISGNEHVFGVTLSQPSDSSQLCQKLTELALQSLSYGLKYFSLSHSSLYDDGFYLSFSFSCMLVFPLLTSQPKYVFHASPVQVLTLPFTGCLWANCVTSQCPCV